MSLSLIKTNLQTDLAAITGVARAYADLPKDGPASADLPAFLMSRRDPFLTVELLTNSSLLYTWHFDLLFLYKGMGQDTPEAWDDGLEPFPARLLGALYGDLTLDGACMDVDVSGFSFGVISYGTGQYVGFQCQLDVKEEVTTTFDL